MADGPKAILIAGPTASGKSALALALAEKSGGVIVNSDAMQVYDVLRTITARPDATALARAEHRLYGHVPPAKAYSVANWLADAKGVLEAVQAAGRTPIFAGGTGLYFKALIEGLADIPAPDPEVRQHWRDAAETGPHLLHMALADRDPVAARSIPASDTQRLVRALEVYDSTGVPLSRWLSEGRRASLLASVETRKILLAPPRDALCERIGRRFEKMVADGALDEIRMLQKLALSPRLPAMKAIGVRQLLRYLEGETTLPVAIESAKAATRQYAKRQTTWFRHQLGPGWEIMSGFDRVSDQAD
jgi:tRNA dimethylallyltransferase